MQVFRLLCAAAIAGGAISGAAWARSAAAPDYISSEPPHESKLENAPEEVVIRFSEPLDAQSTIVVRDECGSRIDDENVEIIGNEMRVGVAVPRKGEHKATFRAVGIAGATGSRSGTISYQVRNGKALGCKPVPGHGDHPSGHTNGGSGRPHGRGHGTGGGEHDGGKGHAAGPSGHGTKHEAAGIRHDRHGRRNNKHAGMDHEKGGAGKHDEHDGHDALAEALDENAAEIAAEERNAFAADDTTAGATADGSAVLAAIAVAILLGAIGGWILRETAPTS